MGDGSGEGLSEDEKLLELQKELRAEMRLLIRQESRQILTGLTAIGAIIGYSLYGENLTLISSVPLVLGLIFIEVVTTANGVMQIARQMIDVELELTERDSPFRYEIQRGVLVGTKWPSDRDESRAWLHLNLHGVPSYAQLAILVVVYVTSIVAAAQVFWPANGVSLLGVTVSRNAVLYSYVLYTLLLAVVLASHLKLRKRQTDDARAAMAEEREGKELEDEEREDDAVDSAAEREATDE